MADSIRAQFALQAIGDVIGELELIHDDLDDPGVCPYFRRGEPGQPPDGTCSFGCVDEPSCQTCDAPPGWPSWRLRRVIIVLKAQLGG